MVPYAAIWSMNPNKKVFNIRAGQCYLWSLYTQNFNLWNNKIPHIYDLGLLRPFSLTYFICPMLRLFLCNQGTFPNVQTHGIRQWHSAVSVSFTHTHFRRAQGVCVELSPPHAVCYILSTPPNMGLLKETSHGRYPTPLLCFCNYRPISKTTWSSQNTQTHTPAVLRAALFWQSRSGLSREIWSMYRVIRRN